MLHEVFGEQRCQSISQTEGQQGVRVENGVPRCHVPKILILTSLSGKLPTPLKAAHCWAMQFKNTMENVELDYAWGHLSPSFLIMHLGESSL